MRFLLLALTAVLTLFLAAPVATAVYQPPPICMVCGPLVVIVATCAEAEANQDALNSGDGCVIVNQQQQCVADESDQDLYNEGPGCGYVNSEQSNLDCQLRAIEALVGLAPHC
jgi:hypothetical protein